MIPKSSGNNTIVQKRVGSELVYIANIGKVIYNNSIVNITNIIVPILNQGFFVLPQDRDKYTAVNAYYKVENGQFVFDQVGKYDSFIKSSDSKVLFNLIPIAQFILHQVGTSYEVVRINEVSKIATFAVTTTKQKGSLGLPGAMGETGVVGLSGAQGSTGVQGQDGITGPQGLTGLGVRGLTGQQGLTGVYPDDDLILHLKFKSGDYKQTDYSIYERDCTWTLNNSSSYFSVETGVEDNCHAIGYSGGTSYYKRNEFLDYGITGAVIHAWMKVDIPPNADFEYFSGNQSFIGLGYTGVFSNPLQIKFSDTSDFFPDEWHWDFGDGTSSTAQSPLHVFPTYNEYIITLTASNASGSSVKYDTVTLIP